jgi:hypothetical protein
MGLEEVEEMSAKYDPVLIRGEGYRVEWWRAPGEVRVVRHIEDPALLNEGEEAVRGWGFETEQEARYAGFFLACEMINRKYNFM